MQKGKGQGGFTQMFVLRWHSDSQRLMQSNRAVGMLGLNSIQLYN